MSLLALTLSGWDWLFLGWFLAVSLGVGVWYTKRAGKSLSEYFLSGRDLPWWALGTSMIATSFASDTPLIVAGFVLTGGVAKNWLWWCLLAGGTLTVFVFSRAWRRAEVTTEIELIARRYDGAAARWLRGFKAIYLGLLMNSLVFGWVTKAMEKVLRTVLPTTGLFANPAISVGLLVVVTLVYTALSGLWGVVATDVLQFAMAMIGAILVAALGVAQAGGLGPMVERVRELSAASGRDFLSLVPTGRSLLLSLFLIPVLIQWWATYYPGCEPGGGGYVAQRMFAAKDENHARLGTLWYIFFHYAVRPWPWILTGLAALVLAPRFAGLDAAGHPLPADVMQSIDAESAYPWMFQFLPVGLLGLVIASFFAAYMSTITSILNLSASYLVNDLWLPFLARSPSSADGAKPDATAARHQVLVARGAVLLVTIAGCVVTWLLSAASDGWTIVWQFTAGSGLVLLARWLWWRVNAWSEIAAMVGSALCCAGLRTAPGEALVPADLRLPCTVAITTLFWITVTFCTKPVGAETLARFFTSVKPGGFWGPVARATGQQPASLRRDLVLWIAATAAVFGCLFTVGHALLGEPRLALIDAAVAIAGGVIVVKGLRHP